MVLWRIWHAHNEITHDKPCPSIEGSRRFLISYMNSLLLIKQFPAADVVKGKMVVNHEMGLGPKISKQDGRQKVKKKWCPPMPGEVKLNVDGAFVEGGGAGAGMVLRDHMGEVVFSACCQICHCKNPTEVELTALEEGLKLSLTLTSLNITVETDCADAVNLIRKGAPNTSIHAFRITRIRELLQERDIQLFSISRDANGASHELARMGRVQNRTESWLRSFPQEIAKALDFDRNPARA